ncbi:unnamed protein product [Rotaria socialis]|uniref:CCHC-type domain-containing protein n=1 Tax=Rotaria socialis TaxID=392032 RepID=A0A822BFM8_9BILA|nr:unnamed protein product [Rotaria socialis]CAF5017853.1 unnamed protein product [Rotaria socialis]
MHEKKKLDRLVTTSVNETDSAIVGTAAFNNTFHSNVAMDNTEHFNNTSNTSSKLYFNKAYSSRSLRCYQCNKVGHIARNCWVTKNIKGAQWW